MILYPVSMDAAEVRELVNLLDTRSGFDPEAAASFIEEHGMPPNALLIPEMQNLDDATLERIICNSERIDSTSRIRNAAETVMIIRREVEAASSKIQKESDARLMRMERSYTAIFAVFTVIVFALAGGIFLALAGIGISYSDGNIVHLRTAILIIGAFFLTVLSIIIRLVSSLVPPMHKKEKRSLPARFIAALKQPIAIAMLFLIAGIVTSEADTANTDTDRGQTSSAVQNTLSNVIPIAEDILIDL